MLKKLYILRFQQMNTHKIHSAKSRARLIKIKDLLNLIGRTRRSLYLKPRRCHRNWDTDQEYAEHSEGSVALPVLGTAVRSTRQAPHLLPEITAVRPVHMVVLSSAHSRFPAIPATERRKTNDEVTDFVCWVNILSRLGRS